MPKHFRAVTENGTIYKYNGGTVFVYYKDDEDGYPKETVYPMGFSVVDRDALSECTSNEEFWQMLRDAPQADAPEVGKSMYIYNFSNWRLSMPVISVEILSDDD